MLMHYASLAAKISATIAHLLVWPAVMYLMFTDPGSFHGASSIQIATFLVAIAAAIK